MEKTGVVAGEVRDPEEKDWQTANPPTAKQAADASARPTSCGEDLVSRASDAVKNSK